jgi:hypothetical protein
MNHRAIDWACLAGVLPLAAVIVPMAPAEARVAFLARYDEICAARALAEAA